MINSSIRKDILFQFGTKKEYQKPHVYLKRSRFEKIFIKFESEVNYAVKIRYGAVDSSAIFLTRKLLPAINKDALYLPPSKACSYINRCDSLYVGHSSQGLRDKIAQHIPKVIQNKCILLTTLPTCNCKTKLSTIQNCDSAIGPHFLQNGKCA